MLGSDAMALPERAVVGNALVGVGNQTAQSRIPELDEAFAVDPPMSTHGDDHTERIDHADASTDAGRMHAGTLARAARRVTRRRPPRGQRELAMPYNQ